MCVIIVKPSGTPLPPLETLQACYRTNPDGAGIMYIRDGMVQLHKGFMRFDDLMRTLEKMEDSTSVPMVLHFRIGTQGKNNPANTHPFPVTDNTKTLDARRSTATVALAHNGIISMTSTYTLGNAKHKETHSDTWYFVRDYVSLVIRDATYHNDANTVTLLARMADSKLAILGNDGHIEMIGAFTQENDGCWYSNLYHFAPVRTIGTLAKSSSVSLFDDVNEYRYDTMRDELVSTRKVAAQYLDGDLWLYCADTGEMISTDDGLFAIDATDNVYEYDDALDALLPMTGYQAITDNLDAVHMDAGLAFVMHVAE